MTFHYSITIEKDGEVSVASCRQCVSYCVGNNEYILLNTPVTRASLRHLLQMMEDNTSREIKEDDVQ